MLVEESILSINKRRFAPMKRDYLSTLKDWRNSQMRVLRQPRPLTDADQDNWFKKISKDKHQVILAIVDEADSFIGYCGITYIDYDNSRGEISFLMDPKRVADNALYREDFLCALYALCQYGFETLKLHKLYTETYTFRDFHISILEEFGLKPGGILREHKRIDEKYVDSIMHCILEQEWPQAKEKVKDVLGQ